MALTPPSSTDPFSQQLLARDASFLVRVQMALLVVAGQVLGESSGTPGHATRVQFARSVQQTANASAGQIAPFLVTRANLVSTNYSAGLSGSALAIASDVTDAAIQSQLSTDWNELCGNV